MREIPSLQSLCFRSVGSHACSAETTFAKSSSGSPSTASRLLRSYHERPISAEKALDSVAAPPSTTMSCIPLLRTPCIGPGSYRRVQANEVDLHHPVTACIDIASNSLIAIHSNTAIDTLQSYIDSLVELGRMDDVRLGRHFWDEWKLAITLPGKGEEMVVKVEFPKPSKRHRRQQQHPSATKVNSSSSPINPRTLGSVSLYNCVLADETLENMREAGVGPYLAVLDLTGVRGLTDDLLSSFLPTCYNLSQLSLKNCRRITNKTLNVLATHLKKLVTLDVGGAFNMDCNCIVYTVVPKLLHLRSLHASGLGWSDSSMNDLVTARDTWTSLSFNFSLNLTHSSLKNSLANVADSLTSLALAFCESFVDNAALGLLGRNLPNIVSLDVRGNHQLNTMSGWYDGRVSADLPAQKLVVLARYSGISGNSVEETRRVHPLDAVDLIVVLDSGGMGAGITRINEASETR